MGERQSFFDAHLGVVTNVFSERCFKVHFKMPYKWEVREFDRWTDLPDNEAIEKDYCDPAKTYRYFWDIVL